MTRWLRTEGLGRRLVVTGLILALASGVFVSLAASSTPATSSVGYTTNYGPPPPTPNRSNCKDNQYGNNQYGNNQYGNNQYGNNQYGNNQYGNNQYGNNQYGNNQYGNKCFDRHHGNKLLSNH